MEIARAVLVVNNFQDQVSIERWDSERSGTRWWLPCPSGAEIVASFVIMVGSRRHSRPDGAGALRSPRGHARGRVLPRPSSCLRVVEMGTRQGLCGLSICGPDL